MLYMNVNLVNGHAVVVVKFGVFGGVNVGSDSLVSHLTNHMKLQQGPQRQPRLSRRHGYVMSWDPCMIAGHQTSRHSFDVKMSSSQGRSTERKFLKDGRFPQRMTIGIRHCTFCAVITLDTSHVFRGRTSYNVLRIPTMPLTDHRQHSHAISGQ